MRLNKEQNNGTFLRQIIYFKEDVFIQIQNLRTPLRILSVPNENCNCSLIGMDAISKCTFLSYTIEYNYNYILELKKSDEIPFLDKTFERGIILSKSNDNCLDLYNYDISNELFVTTRMIRLLEIDTHRMKKLFGIKFHKLDDPDIYFHFRVIFEIFDGVIFNFGGQINIILNKDYNNIERIERVERVEELEHYRRSVSVFNFKISDF